MRQTKTEFGRKIISEPTPEPKPPVLSRKPVQPKCYLERRLELDRLPQFKGLKLTFNAGTGSHDGVLKNISKNGARIETNQPYYLPDVFTIKTNFEDIDTKCYRIWSNDNSVGVKFCK